MSWFCKRSESEKTLRKLVMTPYKSRNGPRGTDQRTQKGSGADLDTRPRDTPPLDPQESRLTANRSESAMTFNTGSRYPSSTRTVCDLMCKADYDDILDAVKKLLQVSNIDHSEGRKNYEEFRAAMVSCSFSTYSCADKSSVISTYLDKANNIDLPADVSQVVQIVREMTAVLEL